MGSEHSKEYEESKFVSDHPAFQDAKVIADHDKRIIQANIPAQDKVYDAWKDSIHNSLHPLSGEHLLLPDNTTYKHSDGVCGNNGVVTVHIQLP